MSVSRDVSLTNDECEGSVTSGIDAEITAVWLLGGDSAVACFMSASRDVSLTNDEGERSVTLGIDAQSAAVWSLGGDSVVACFNPQGGNAESKGSWHRQRKAK